MFAVVKYGNQQYKVSPNQTIKVDKIDVEEGKTFKTEEVLLVSDKNLEVGTPFLKGTVCEAKVVKHGKAAKVLVFKKKSKKRYERTQGHRQDYTEIEIIKIAKGAAPKAETKKEEAVKESKTTANKAAPKKKTVPKTTKTKKEE